MNSKLLLFLTIWTIDIAAIISLSIFIVRCRMSNDAPLSHNSTNVLVSSQTNVTESLPSIGDIRFGFSLYNKIVFEDRGHLFIALSKDRGIAMIHHPACYCFTNRVTTN